MLVCVLALVAVGAMGCTSAPEGTAGAEDATLRPRPGDRRSLVFESPVQRRVTAQALLEPGLPWYVDRNEAERRVAAGYISPTFQQSNRLVVDRQRSFDGRPSDHYHSTTYRREVTRGVQ